MYIRAKGAEDIHLVARRKKWLKRWFSGVCDWNKLPRVIKRMFLIERFNNPFF